MGEVAKRGIASGRKILIGKDQRDESAREPIDSLSRDILTNMGFQRIADKLIAGATLKSQEIEEICLKASPPVLMKLVSLRDSRRTLLSPTPVLYLPIASMLDTYTPERTIELCSAKLDEFKDIETLEVVIGKLGSLLEDRCFLEVVKTVVGTRENLRLIGPRIEDLYCWLESSRVPNDERAFVTGLEKALATLRDIGCYRLRALHVRGALKLLVDFGFEVSLVSNLNAISSASELVRELVKIDNLCREEPQIKTWLPSAGTSSGRGRYKTAMGDIAVLKGLALGYLVLDQMPVIRASSRFMSPVALELAAYMGATELGCGAVCEETQANLQFSSYKLLENLTREFNQRNEQN